VGGARTDAAEAFNYTISHDLRAPLRVVEGFSKILKEDYGRTLDRIGNDHIDRILAAAHRMHNMIDALLSLSRLSNKPLERAVVDLSELAGSICEDLRREHAGRSVTVSIEPGLQAQGDATLLRMALENLLSNAWKYTNKRPQAEIQFIRHASQPQTFTVRDNGAGFDMRFADRLFCAFQRLHSASDFQGHGVGLASVKRIINRHGGSIWAESEVGRGAQFHFSLPAPELARRAAPAP
jgi:light-regulated signal transduction histidine kinase (bacteriophytochrome)